MMRKRRLVQVVVLLVLVWAALAGRKFFRPGVTRGNAERIEAGMTLQDVEARLGRPADEGSGRMSVWHGEDGVRVSVQFDLHGARVVTRTISPDDPTLGEYLGFLRPW
jgi:hypothetical protein